jgi:predicted aconitase with swiveling domain
VLEAVREIKLGRTKVIVGGRAEGEALVSLQPITFFGGVDAKTGEVIEGGHEIRGQRLAGRVLVFPHGKGSTVGSYVLYSLAKRRIAPAAIINSQFDAIVTSGCVMGGIPLLIMPQEARLRIREGDVVRIGRSGRMEALRRGPREP